MPKVLANPKNGHFPAEHIVVKLKLLRIIGKEAQDAFRSLPTHQLVGITTIRNVP